MSLAEINVLKPEAEQGTADTVAQRECDIENTAGRHIYSAPSDCEKERQNNACQPVLI